MPEQAASSPAPWRALDSTGLEVSALCAGCASLGGVRASYASVTEEERALAVQPIPEGMWQDLATVPFDASDLNAA